MFRTLGPVICHFLLENDDQNMCCWLLSMISKNQAPAIVILLELKRVEAKLDQNDLFLVILHVIWMKNGYFGPFSHHFEWICCKITVISSNLRNFRDFKRNSMILMIVILPQKAWYFSVFVTFSPILPQNMVKIMNERNLTFNLLDPNQIRLTLCYTNFNLNTKT